LNTVIRTVTLNLQRILFPWSFPTKMSPFQISRVHHKWPLYLLVLDLITLTVAAEHKLWRSSLCGFFPSPIAWLRGKKHKIGHQGQRKMPVLRNDSVLKSC
jgi:hypothetical protein